MQILIRVLLSIYLGHLLTDFVFQSDALVRRKRQGRLSGYALHGLIHYVSAACLAGFFVPGVIRSLRLHAVLVGLTAVHLLIDLAKIQLAGRRLIQDGPLAYAADQFAHLATVFVAACWIVPTGLRSAVTTVLVNARSLPNTFLAVPIVYVAIVFGGGYLIRFLTRSLAEGIHSHSPEKANEQLQNAGLYIGWLERFLVITALLLQSPAMVGLILTAKSIARYPEFKSERFAEYFLIGTLLSVGLALIGGAILNKIIFGHVRMA